MRTTGKSQNGHGARARAKVLYRRVKVGARVMGVCKFREGGWVPGRPRGWDFLTSARAAYEVVSDIQRVPRKYLSRDRVEAQELVTLEAVVAAEPPNGRGAVPNGWPTTLLCGSCCPVPEPYAVTFVQSINKHSVRPAYALPVLALCPRIGQIWS